MERPYDRAANITSILLVFYIILCIIMLAAISIGGQNLWYHDSSFYKLNFWLNL